MKKLIFLTIIFYFLKSESLENNFENLELNIKIENEENIFTVNSENNEYLNEILEIIRRPKPKNYVDDLKTTIIQKHSQDKKDWTILIYIAGDNNLYKFALRNLEQLKQVGSNELLNIVVHFDYHRSNGPKKTRRFYIERNNILEIGTYPWMDSGSDKTLIDASRWAIKNYPSNNFALVLWNHGSGDLNLVNHLNFKLINPSEFFYYDGKKKQIVLDKKTTFSDLLIKETKEKGICFDDTTLNYLDDKKLINAFEQICGILNETNGKKKIDVILMDACLMSGIGTAYLCSKYADYLTASQEVVMGPGYNYQTMLKVLSKVKMTPKEFVKHIVDNYEKTYNPITQDYTESGLNLNYMDSFISEFNKFCDIINDFIKIDQNELIKKTIKYCAGGNICISFEEPAYIDFGNFLDNIFLFSSKINLKNNNGLNFSDEIKKQIVIIKNLLKKLVEKNVNGKNYYKATGLSIYFPKNFIDKNYKKTLFGSSTKWGNVLEKII